MKKIKPIRVVSFLVVEIFLCSSILPVWAYPTSFLRPKPAVERFFAGGKKVAARDGGERRYDFNQMRAEELRPLIPQLTIEELLEVIATDETEKIRLALQGLREFDEDPDVNRAMVGALEDFGKQHVPLLMRHRDFLIWDLAEIIAERVVEPVTLVNLYGFEQQLIDAAYARFRPSDDVRKAPQLRETDLPRLITVIAMGLAAKRSFDLEGKKRFVSALAAALQTFSGFLDHYAGWALLRLGEEGVDISEAEVGLNQDWIDFRNILPLGGTEPVSVVSTIAPARQLAQSQVRGKRIGTEQYRLGEFSRSKIGEFLRTPLERRMRQASVLTTGQLSDLHELFGSLSQMESREEVESFLASYDTEEGRLILHVHNDMIANVKWEAVLSGYASNEKGHRHFRETYFWDNYKETYDLAARYVEVGMERLKRGKPFSVDVDGARDGGDQNGTSEDAELVQTAFELIAPAQDTYETFLPAIQRAYQAAWDKVHRVEGGGRSAQKHYAELRQALAVLRRHRHDPNASDGGRRPLPREIRRRAREKVRELIDKGVMTIEAEDQKPHPEIFEALVELTIGLIQAQHRFPSKQDILKSFIGIARYVELNRGIVVRIESKKEFDRLVRLIQRNHHQWIGHNRRADDGGGTKPFIMHEIPGAHLQPVGSIHQIDFMRSP